MAFGQLSKRLVHFTPYVLQRRSLLCFQKYNIEEADGDSSGLGLNITMVDTGKERASALRQADTEFGSVIENTLLTTSGPAKRHIEIKLPEGMSYRTGDYLAM
jgi:hypothetical protein